MKIIQTTFTYVPDIGGGSVIYTFNIANQLSNEGHDVRVFCGTSCDKTLREKVSGIEVTRISTGKLSFIKRLFPFFQYYKTDIEKKFDEFLRKEQPDIVHFNSLGLLGISLISIPRKLGIPSVATLHDGFWVCNRLFFVQSMTDLPCEKKTRINCTKCSTGLLENESVFSIRFIFRFIKNFINYFFIDIYLKKQLKLIDCIISPSKFISDKYKKKNIKIINHGIDVSLFRKIKKTNEPYIRFGFIGGISDIKGYNVLNSAVQKADVKQRVHLSVWGNKDKKEIITLKNSGSTITFNGYFLRENISDVFNDIDVLIVPSMAQESFGMAVLEAFAAGIPVVASRIGAIPELLEDNKTGLLFEFGNATDLSEKMLSVIENPNLISKFKSNIGKIKTIEDYATEILGVYNQLLEN